MEPIADALLAFVVGGSMPWDPNLLATVEQTGRKKPPRQESPEMLTAVRSLGTAMSGLVSTTQQTQQQSSQAMMQMLPQMLGAR